MMSGLLNVEVANWKIVGLLVSVSLLLLVVACARARHRVLLAALATSLGLLAGADAVNTHFGYLPQLADVVGVSDWPVIPNSALHARPPVLAHELAAATWRIGGVVEIRVVGFHSGVGAHRAYVYLPPQYFTQPAARFPVVYLLHGSPGRAQDWLRAAHAVQTGSAVAAARRPVILVMPTMSGGWLDDSECVDGRPGHWDSWLTSDVVPSIDATFRTVARRSGRALAGMSAGGYCALNLMLRHSAEFSAAVDLSGYTTPTHSGGLVGLFGATWRSDAAANTPAEFIRTHDLSLPLRLRFDVGAEDTTPQRQFRWLQPALVAAGVDVVDVHRPGGHTYHVWAPALRSGVNWLSGLFYPRT